MSKRDARHLLEDMLEAGRKIFKYTDGLDLQSFSSNDLIVDAVVRNFEVIGEAANRIGPEFRIKNTQIECNRTRGLRNRVVHEYFGIDNRIIWSIIEDHLGELIDRLQEITGAMPSIRRTKSRFPKDLSVIEL